MEPGKFHCEIISSKISIACGLVDCGFWIKNDKNFNCLKIYTLEKPMEIEDISYVFNLPIWLVKDLKKSALTNLKRSCLKRSLKNLEEKLPITNDENLEDSLADEIKRLETFYSANIRDIMKEAVRIFKSLTILQEVLGVGGLSVKNLIKLYVGKIDDVLPTVKTFREVKYRFLGRRTWHYPQRIENMLRHLSYQDDFNTSMRFEKVDQILEELLLT